MAIKKQKALNVTLYTSSGVLLLMNASSGVVSAAVESNHKQAQESTIMPTAGLADISVLGNASLVSTTGNTMTPNSQGNYDLSLKYSGMGLASVGVADKKVLVYSLPPELQGKVVGGATVQIDAQLLPIVPADVPGVDLLFAAVEAAVDVFAGAVKLLGVDVSGLQDAIDDLKGLKELGSYHDTLPGIVSADGKTISVDFTQGLGNYVNQAYSSLFNGLEDAVNGISSSNPVVNTALTVLKRSTTPLFDLIDEIANGSSTILSSALNANILGQTSGTLTTTVSDPNTATTTVRASVISNAVLSADIISLIDQEGQPVTLNFPNDAVDPLVDYEVALPSLDPATEGETTISGSVALNEPIPEGTTFAAIATLDDGTEISGNVDASGSFVIETGVLQKDQIISVKIKATNGAYTKDSEAASLTVQAGQTSENPLENYSVSVPTVSLSYAGDTSIKGSVTLNQPIPDGTTFNATATLKDGTEVSGEIDENGNFTLDTGMLNEGDILSVKIVATNGEYTKESSSVSVTVQATIGTENPLADYDVATPTVDSAYAGDTSIKGTVALNQPIPEGTTFEAVVIQSDGTEATGIVAEDGKFVINTGELKEKDNLSVKIRAKNDVYSKDSASTAVTVQPLEITNPLENYNVSSPAINPAVDGDTSVEGSVELEQPIPEGTIFEAVITMPDGSEKKAAVDADGKFTVETGELKEGDAITVKVVATNGENTKESSPVSIVVQPGIEVTNPLNDYEVSKPDVDVLTEGDKQIKGSVDLVQPVPENTTFEAVAILADGTEKTGSVAANGDFTIETGILEKDAILSVKIRAHNDNNVKDSISVSVVVQPAKVTNPLENYNVISPVVNPVTSGDTSVGGSVTLERPIPEGTTFETVITMPDGNEKKAIVDVDGNFTVETGELKEGDVISVKVVAINGENTKESSPVMISVQPEITETNPLSNYEVSVPSVDTVTEGDMQVKGSVDLVQPIPEGTSFETVVTLVDGTEKMGTVDENGQFTVETGALKKDEILSVKVTAKNGDYSKDSASISVNVRPSEATNPLENYNVVSPVVNPIISGDTSVTGSVNLSQPIPEGTTFEAIVTLPDGSELKGQIDETGNFDISTGELKEGDTVSVKIVAHNGNNQKDSSPVLVIVGPAIEAGNPLADYDVSQPVVTPVKADSTSINGSVELVQPIPEGTSFKAVVTLTDGSQKVGVVSANGSFTVETGSLNEGDILSVKITAENGEYTKDGASISVTVEPTSEVTNPLENYNVASPTVNPIVSGDTSVSGSVEVTKPIPEGTSFEVIVTLPDGTEVKGQIDENGKFTVETGELKEGDTVSVKVVAHNGNDQKESSPISVTVGSKIPDTNPLANYIVNAPIVDEVLEGATTINGSVNLTQPIPEGTTFEAVATLADGTEVKGRVDENGDFSIETIALNTGEIISIRITAQNDGYFKDSASISVTVGEKEEINPLEDYEVATPVVDKITDGDMKVNGSVVLNQPIPEGTIFEVVVTLSNGMQRSFMLADVQPFSNSNPHTGSIDENGRFSIDTEKWNSGEYVDVQIIARNTNFEKSSQKVSVLVDSGLPSIDNPLNDYEVRAPSVDSIIDGDTQVTGSVEFNQPVPEGTDFEVVVILSDGSERTGAIGSDGKFTVETGKLNKDDQVRVKVVAKNGQYSKNSNIVQINVGANDTGGNTGGGDGNNNNGGNTGGGDGNNNNGGNTGGGDGNNNNGGNTGGGDGNNNNGGNTGGGDGNNNNGGNTGGGDGNNNNGGNTGGGDGNNNNGGNTDGNAGNNSSGQSGNSEFESSVVSGGINSSGGLQNESLSNRNGLSSSGQVIGNGSIVKSNNADGQNVAEKSNKTGMLPKAGEKTAGIISIGGALLALIVVMFKKVFKKRENQ
ncbi:adhesive domain-containing protein [Companilactobacillus bobalius]|uniref:Putative adhesive domain-containing protein n=1 Tax=Companilactobacillus bobalius DSM 19674 TaxID=1423788 RepID=A0A0R1KMW9_9LACO|nr:adhesive domain-containing protein [Companilactobacillus bobalius]KAE9559576.1 hypothetical protein ATN92_11915 [Companilactobacillus bobalius]KAE9561507.1 hypothetical protein ATN92_05345 [Companilactobacillus bobalius]KRK82404.1 hypothetical protein FC78_GL002410 [Companilactobacillus bobalius DSM 19674]GEO59264.1 cell wall surface anchor protein [Companilactobacillus paralimentarius]